MTDAETVLRKLLNKIFDKTFSDEEISLKSLTSGGANYTSALYSVTVNSKDEEPLKLFAKIANINEKLREVMPVRRMFETEQFVYSDLVEAYERIQDRHNVAPEHRFVFPKYYGGNDAEGEETVVLEDLVDKGYSPYSRFNSIDWEHAARAVESLAKFHALSFALAKEEPELFAKALEKVKTEIPEKSDDPVMMATWNKMMDGGIQVSKAEYKERISAFLSEVDEKEIYKFKLPLGVPVLCHGDYRISNLLFQRRNGDLEVIVLDFQTLHSGSPTIDLLYLEFMGSDEAFRRENHERLLDHYFSELTLALDRLGIDVNEVYPRETFDSELKEMLPTALRTATFILPLVLVEADRAPQLETSASVESFAVSPNELFAERYSGLVNDCVRWGVLFIILFFIYLFMYLHTIQTSQRKKKNNVYILRKYKGTAYFLKKSLFIIMIR